MINDGDDITEEGYTGLIYDGEVAYCAVTLFGQPLAPPDIVPALRVDRKGKVIPAYTLETPLDQNGVPDPKQVITMIMNEISTPYQWPPETNIHHTAWPRRDYDGSPTDRAYRNDTSLLVLVPIQFHNLAHKLMEQPPKPAYDIMHQRVLEQRQRDLLFEYGRRALRYSR